MTIRSRATSRSTRAVALAAALAAGAAAAAPAGAVPAAVPPAAVVADDAGSAAMCAAGQLSLSTDAEDGNFDAASHAGTLIVVRNRSASTCRIEPFYTVTFRDRAGNALHVSAEVASPFGGRMSDGRRVPMGHGPVVLPLALAAGAEATSAATWVSNAVFDRSACVDSASLAVTVGDATLRTPLAAHLCGADAGHIRIEIHRLVRDRLAE